MSSRRAYRPDLDGLRALAVLPVIFFHLGFPQVSGGFVGVDVFFVLSGYFITQRIVEDLAEGRFTLLSFYDRRLRRLFPALFVMLTISTAVALFVLAPNELERYGYTLAAAGLSLSNFVFWNESGYFGPAAQTAPLLHTWSLAVEEQFYILFPIILMIISRFGRSNLVSIILALSIVSCFASIVLTYVAPAFTFYLLPTRLWELALGALLAVKQMAGPLSNRHRDSLAVFGLVAIAIAIVSFSKDIPFPGAAALLPCVGCALVILSGKDFEGSLPNTKMQPGLAMRILSWRPLVFTGQISYSLYLWHWPIIVFAKLSGAHPEGPLATLAFLIAMFAVAVVSWRFVEQPFRYGTFFWPSQWSRYSWSFSGVAMIVAIGWFAHVADGLPQRISTRAYKISQQARDSSPLRKRCHANGKEDRPFQQTCVFGAADGIRVVLFSDSHGTELSFALSEMTETLGMHLRQITASSCPPAFGMSTKRRAGCYRHVAAMMDGLKSAPPSIVILTASFSTWNKPKFKKQFWLGFKTVVMELVDAGHTVIILGDVPPNPNGNVPNELVRWIWQGRLPKDYSFAIDRPQAREIDTNLAKIAAENGALYIPLEEYVCRENKRCFAYNNGSAIYFDSHHLSTAMARRVIKELVVPSLRDIRVSPRLN